MGNLAVARSLVLPAIIVASGIAIWVPPLPNLPLLQPDLGIVLCIGLAVLTLIGIPR